ncbi:hypothetical protein Cni_G18811 [Canna indica]|uniref:Uncharacterized protein n=1 Tax=Canna indica TaxID=4628 RepID=A0AAQ3KLS0_9LILI|nr:hypothetical protein Cni_G18811 [Canna indica]
MEWRRRLSPAAALAFAVSWMAVLVAPDFAEDSYAYFVWDVSFITAAPLGVKQQVFTSLSTRVNNLVRIRSNIQERPIVAIPDLPGRAPIELPCAELPNFLLEKNHMTDAWDLMKEAQLGCHGV